MRNKKVNWCLVLFLVGMLLLVGGCTGGPSVPISAEPVGVKYEGWGISLDGGDWRGSSLTVKLTITNFGPRRTLDPHGFGYSMKLVAIDSTNKVVEAKGASFLGKSSYHKEYYPEESWSGSLSFKMSPYSGETKLYLTRFSGTRKCLLFNLGSP